MSIAFAQARDCGEFLVWLMTCKLLRKDFAAWSYSFSHLVNYL